MNLWLRWALASVLILGGGISCRPKELKESISGSTRVHGSYSCEVYAFGGRPPCVVVISRMTHADRCLITELELGELRVDGVKVTDDGKLTVHWKQGTAHRQTVLESGPLYEALRVPASSLGKTQENLNTDLLDAFFAEHAK